MLTGGSAAEIAVGFWALVRLGSIDLPCLSHALLIVQHRKQLTTPAHVSAIPITGINLASRALFVADSENVRISQYVG